MEPRTDLRINSGAPVAITLLKKADGNWSGEFVNANGSEATIRLDAGLEVGSLLKLETGEEWMLAEVSYCESTGSGYQAQLTLVEWISKIELRRLQSTAAEEPELVAA